MQQRVDNSTLDAYPIALQTWLEWFDECLENALQVERMCHLSQWKTLRARNNGMLFQGIRTLQEADDTHVYLLTSLDLSIFVAQEMRSGEHQWYLLDGVTEAYSSS